MINFEGKRTALYYPTIAIPNSSWLRKALLYWDEVASIVPYNYGKTLPHDIKYLESVNAYRAIYPGKITKVPNECFEAEFFSILYSKEFRKLLGFENTWVSDVFLYKDKSYENITERLLSMGLAKETNSFIYDDKIYGALIGQILFKGLARKKNEGYIFERNTALLYMSLLAKYLSNMDDNLTIPSTDRIEYRDLIYIMRNNNSNSLCADILIGNILPEPGKGVPLNDILEFKELRRDELLHFRQIVDRFGNELGTSQNTEQIRDTCIRFKEEVERGLLEITMTMRDAKMKTAFGSLSTLVSLRSPTFWASLGAPIAKELFKIPIELSMVGLGLIGLVQVSSYFVDRRNDVANSMRNSAFSYLYHSKTLS